MHHWLNGGMQWRRPGAKFGGHGINFRRPRFLNDDIFWKNSKNFWWPFLVIDQVFSNFPFLLPDFPYLYYVKCRKWPFPHKKNTFLLFWYVSAHPTTLLLKIFGGTDTWAVPHLTFLGEPSPQFPLGLRGWTPLAGRAHIGDGFCEIVCNTY